MSQPKRIQIQIRKPHSKPALGRVGKLIQALERVQVCVARADLEAAWWVAERAIECNNDRH